MSMEGRGAEAFDVHDLTVRLTEAQETLTAIRTGAVDAVVVATDDGQQVYVLEGADQAHRILLETLNEGAATIAADATILYANRKLAEVLGRTPEKVLGHPLTRFLTTADAPRFAELLAEAARGRSKGEVGLIAAGGGVVPVMLSMSAIGDAANETYAVVVTDLTMLKAAQAALEQANDALEARVEARTADLSAANARLFEADERKNEFLSMLAHELRNPLAAISMATEVIRETIGDEPGSPALESCSGAISRQVKNLTRIVDDLLDVARITRGAITLRKQPVELAALVRSAVDATRPLLDTSAHELVVSLPPEPLEFFVDPTRFEQVLVNLLTNAAKYTKPGGRITVSAQHRGDELILRVADTGMGIPEDLLLHIFDLFVQGARTLDRSQGGLGLGLTLVRKLVGMHGGTIEAHSAGPGQGSEFVIRLPIEPSQQAAAAPALSYPAHPR